MNKSIDNYSLLIVDYNQKEKIIKSLSKDKIRNQKIITLDELRKKYYFDYNNESIYYIMKKYNYNYDVAKMYLSHIYEVDNNSNLEKSKIILEIKKDLIENNLLITYPFYKEYLKQQNILVYNINFISKLDKKMLNEISNITNIDYLNEETNTYNHEEIVVCNTKEEEVYFIAGKISKLIKDNIDIKRIKVYAKKEYEEPLRRVFEWFNIPLSLSSHTLYTTAIGKLLLSNLDKSKKECLEIIENTISLKNKDNLSIYNQIIKIINNYTWNDSLKELEPFIISDLKKTTINEEININVVTIIDNLDNIRDEDYIFLLGFNQGEIPEISKDEDYFNREEKILLNLDTPEEINIKNKQIWLKKINSIKNLVITMKKNNESGECYISNLNDELNLKEVFPEEDYTNSNLYNKIELTKKLDTLIKYNELEKNIDILYNNYQDIDYNTFNNNYHQIDKDRIRKYLNNKLTLSYSSMNTYFQCSFRYYINNILKLNKYEETFYTIIGNLFHHILSLYYTKDINIKEEYQKYIDEQNYNFNKRELFFLNKLEKELEFIIETINLQNEDISLNNIITEELVEIKKNYEDMDITFKGYVDKILTNDDKSIMAIIDYKTGNPNLNLNNTIYGLDLQLPVYLYLGRNKYEHALVAGFYLQKLIHTEVIPDKKHTYLELKQDKLKLQGYSNQDLTILKEFDKNYNNSNIIKGMKTTSKGLSTKKILNDEKIEKLINLTEEKINEAIKEISNANFEINPKRIGMDNLGCAYCEFKDICFRTEKNIVNLKEYKNIEFLGGDENDT